MSIFTAIQLSITNLGTPFQVQLPVSVMYFGIIFQGNIPYLCVENVSAVDPGPTHQRTLVWVPANTTYPSGYDEMYPAFFSGNPYLLMIQGSR